MYSSGSQRTTGSQERLSSFSNAHDSDVNNKEFEAEIERQRTLKRPVARIVPAFIDIIILVAQVAAFGGFLYMAYIY